MVDAHADRLQAGGDYERAGWGNTACGNLVCHLTNDICLIIVRHQNALVCSGRVLEN